MTRVAAYRFDDPEGQVGIETILAQSGDGPVYQVPLTYRGAPLTDADEWLVGMMEHSVLGRRWIYDGCADPVYAAALASAILAATGQATEYIEVDGELISRDHSMQIASTGVADAQVPSALTVKEVRSGDPTVVLTDRLELAVLRRLGSGQQPGGQQPGDRAGDQRLVPGAAVLTGSWDAQPDPLPLAYATLPG